MPHSLLLGRGWPAPGEPLWLDDDRAKALAWIAHLREDEAARCSRCGTRHDAWVDPETGKAWGRPILTAEVRECPGCVEMDQELDQVDVDRRRHHHVQWRAI